MALRKIVLQGDECLTKVCRPVTEFNQRLHTLIDDMKETLLDSGGVGLAAPQVGILRRAVIVVDDQDRYQGTVSIADIRLTGHVVKTIEPLIRCNTPTVHTGDSAKDCFDLLISSGAPYLIVLNEEEKVDGIITKTSMTSAMAEQLWG